MDIEVWMLSCAEREAVRAATLERWAGTDWGVAPRVHLDAGEAAGPWGQAARAGRIVAAYGALLAAAVAGCRAEWLLVLEDDLAFAPHLRAALAEWPPLRDPRCVLASLYNPHLAPAPAEPGAEGATGPTWFTARRETFTGAQALLFRPAEVARALARWATVPGMQSARLARLLTAEGGRICVHRPSLVQHVATDSAWGARLHTAGDFDRKV